MYSILSVGMRLELVLNEDEKKERFKASLAKKKGEQEAPDGLPTAPTSYTDNNLSESIAKRVVELMYLQSTLASYRSPMTTSLSSTLASYFTGSPSSCYSRPTGRIAPLTKPSTSTSSSNPALSSSSFDQNMISLNTQLVQHAVNRHMMSTAYSQQPTAHTFNPSTTGVEDNHDTSLFLPIPQTPPSLRSQNHHNMLTRFLYKSGSDEKIDYYSDTALDLSLSSNPTSSHGLGSAVPVIKAGLILNFVLSGMVAIQS